MINRFSTSFYVWQKYLKIYTLILGIVCCKNKLNNRDLQVIP